MADPYARNMFGQFNPYFAKREIRGNLCVILDGSFDDRGLFLISPISRAVKKAEIHEFILTDENAGPGKTVNKISYVGFAEIAEGGIIVVGDKVAINNTVIGTIAGFDETHMPNHLNIVLNGNRITGKSLGFPLETTITIG